MIRTTAFRTSFSCRALAVPVLAFTALIGGCTALDRDGRAAYPHASLVDKPARPIAPASTEAVERSSFAGPDARDGADRPDLDVRDIGTTSREAAAAYRDGRLEQAEELYRSVLRQRQDDAKSTFNLSMVHLEQAYLGLQHYVELGPAAAHRRVIEQLLQSLDRFAHGYE